MKKQITSLLLLAASLVCSGSLNAQIINAFAGDGTNGYSGDGAGAVAAACFAPAGIVTDVLGNVYFADKGNHAIRKVNTAGIITTIAGTGTSGYGGDGGPATAALINSPTSVAVDSIGNVFFTDDANNRIRKINTAGIISTIAGNGTAGYYGDNGRADSAQISHATGVAVDRKGNVYIADANNHVIRKIDTANKIRTIAGSGSAGYSGDGSSANIASLSYPKGVTVDRAGYIYIADNGNSVIRKINLSGIISTIAGNGSFGYSGDGGYGYLAKLNAPTEVAVDTFGSVYIADFGNHVVRKMTSSGYISTYAGNGIGGNSGNGGYANAAQISGPYGVAMDLTGKLYVADEISNVVRVVSKPNGIRTPGSTTAQLLVYPNPTSGVFSVTIPATITQATITVTDMPGRTLKTIITQTPTTEVDLTTFPIGTYMVRLQTDNGLYCSLVQIVK